jgi:hypothetical protein
MDNPKGAEYAGSKKMRAQNEIATDEKFQREGYPPEPEDKRLMQIDDLNSDGP